MDGGRWPWFTGRAILPGMWDDQIPVEDIAVARKRTVRFAWWTLLFGALMGLLCIYCLIAFKATHNPYRREFAIINGLWAVLSFVTSARQFIFLAKESRRLRTIPEPAAPSASGI